MESHLETKSVVSATGYIIINTTIDTHGLPADAAPIDFLVSTTVIGFDTLIES